MIKLQRAKLSDAEEIIRIRVNAFTEEVKLYGIGPDGYDDVEKMRNMINKGNVFLVIDTNLNKQVGGISVIDRGNENYWVSSFQIALDYQSKGVGSQAFHLIEKEFSNWKTFGLDTPYKSFRNHHFYEKLGFVKINEYYPYSNNKEFCLFVYKKEKSSK